MIPKSDKASEVIRYIEGKLISGACSDGDRLPSLRSLMYRFNVSYGTAFRGMEFLIEKTGMIRREKKRGYYVCFPSKENESPASGKVLAVFLPERLDERSMFAAALCGIRKSAEQDGCYLKNIPLSPEHASEVRILAETENCAGAFFLQEYDSVLKNLRMRIPAVGIMMENSYNGIISTVNLDPWDAAETAVNYFLKHRIENVIISGSSEQVYRKRGLCFMLHWKLHGGKCHSVPGKLRTFRKNTGYFFTSDSWANEASVFYQQQNGRPLAQDFTILAEDGKQLLMPEFHRFPTIAVNWELIGQAAYTEFLSRCGKYSIPPKKICFRGVLVEPK